MEVQSEIVDFLESLAAVAKGVQLKITWLLVAGLLAGAGLAWQVYSVDSALWWNITKCTLILLPALVWSFIWFVVGQLREAPNLAVSLASQDDGLLANIQNSNFNQKVGVRSLFSSLRAFRREEGLEVVVDTIGSVTLLANPFFVLLAFVMMVLMILLIIISPLVLLL